MERFLTNFEAPPCNDELVADDKLTDRSRKRGLRDADINVLIIFVDLAVATDCKCEVKLN